MFLVSLGYYMYTEASIPGNEGDVATLLSPQLNVTYPRCLSFYYHMYGSKMGTLNLYGNYGNVVQTKKFWSRHGNNGNRWTKAMITLPSGTYQIMFEAVRGAGYRSDMAIDDVSLETGPCYRTGNHHTFLITSIMKNEVVVFVLPFG